MRKNFFVFFAIFCLSVTSFYAQDFSEANQVVLPLEVFVGDRAEIRYVFHTAIDFFADKKDVEKCDIQNPFVGLEENFSVVSAELYRNNMEYTIRFVIIPWKIGTITFPSFNLNSVLQNSKLNTQNNTSSANFSVALFPIQISSIVEKTNNSQMMPPVPPIIIPGTTYVIFLFVLAAIIFLILFFRILLKFNSIKQKWNEYLRKRAFKKNAEDTLKKIKKLVKTKSLSDIEFCSELQVITRKYLEFRFEYRFTAISSGAIRNVFEKICLGNMSHNVAYAVEDITAMFVRTDYIRYAHDSIDSRLYPPAEHQAALVKSERKSLSEMVIKAINVFESDDDQAESEMEEPVVS